SPSPDPATATATATMTTGGPMAEQQTQGPQDDEEVLDSPRGWVASHVRRYVETGGEDGQVRYGAQNLLITTRGRRSGKLRRTALVYGRDGDRYVLVASNGGAPKHPLWYLNLVADPLVELQVGAERFDARARTATAEEKP